MLIPGFLLITMATGLIIFFLGRNGFCYQFTAITVFYIIHGLIQIQFLRVILKQTHLHGKWYQLAETDTQQANGSSFLPGFVEKVLHFGN